MVTVTIIKRREMESREYTKGTQDFLSNLAKGILALQLLQSNYIMKGNYFVECVISLRGIYVCVFLVILFAVYFIHSL